MNRDKKFFRHRRRQLIENSRLLDAVTEALVSGSNPAGLRRALLRSAQVQASKLQSEIEEITPSGRGRPTALARLRELRRRGRI